MMIYGTIWNGSVSYGTVWHAAISPEPNPGVLMINPFLIRHPPSDLQYSHSLHISKFKTWILDSKSPAAWILGGTNDRSLPAPLWNMVQNFWILIVEGIIIISNKARGVGLLSGL